MNQFSFSANLIFLQSKDKPAMYQPLGIFTAHSFTINFIQVLNSLSSASVEVRHAVQFLTTHFFFQRSNVE